VLTLQKRMIIRTDLREAKKAEDLVMSEVHRRAYDESAAFAIRLALEEGLNNAIKHGNCGNPEKVVELCYDVDDRRVAIAIADEGSGFDPAAVPDPTSDENLEKPCGRGIMLMRAYMDEVRFNRVGNQVRMIKRNT
jgi:serine/threonine-protein kinase RsbW